MSEADNPKPIPSSSEPDQDHHLERPRLQNSDFLEENISTFSQPLDNSPVKNQELEATTDPDSDLSVIKRTSPEKSVSVNFAKEADWFTQARKQRQRNRELVKKVAQLEQALTEAQEQLSSKRLRVKSSDTLIRQQSEELYLTQQQLNILEEECSILRKREQEQAEKLLQAETDFAELSERLRCQQRKAQQFKSALDKCLDSTTENIQILAKTEIPEADFSLVSSPSPTLNSGNPIQSWSKPSQEQSLKEELGKLSSLLEVLPEEVDAEAEELESETTTTEVLEVEPETCLIPEVTEKIEAVLESEPPLSVPPEKKAKPRLSHYPSPTVYPLRTSKKRKSLAAINLPSFPPVR